MERKKTGEYKKEGTRKSSKQKQVKKDIKGEK